MDDPDLFVKQIMQDTPSPILKMFPNYATVNNGIDDLDYFAREIAQDISPVIPQEYAKRLAGIRSLSCQTETLPVNAMITSFKYLTNLDSFILNVFNCDDWGDLQKHLFSVDIMQLLTSVRQAGMVNLQRLDLTFLSANFTTVMRRVFDDLPTKVQGRTIQTISEWLCMEKIVTQNAVDLMLRYFNKGKYTRFVDIAARYGLDLHEIVSLLFTSQLDNVDMFELELKNKYYTNAKEVDMDTYEKMLSKLPLLKKVILDIPLNFKESAQVLEGYSGTVQHQVEEFTLKATPKVKLQALLDRFQCTFPNVKQLQIYYSSGTFNAQSDVFELLLPEYSLKELTLDLTQVKRKTLALSVPFDDYFFVIDVQLSNDRQLFQVAVNLSSATRIEEEELDGFTCGVDFYRVHVTASSLVRLQLLVDFSEDRSPNIPSYMSYPGRKKTRLIRLDYSE